MSKIIGVTVGTPICPSKVQERIKPELEAFIAEELAKKTQLKPEFVQTVADMTDTSKLYVYNGNIWAWMAKEVAIGGYKNLAEPFPETPDVNTTWMNGYRLGSSGTPGPEYAGTPSSISNVIACKYNNEIRIAGVELRPGSDRIVLTATQPNGNDILIFAYAGSDLVNGAVTYLKYQGVTADDVYGNVYLYKCCDGSYPGTATIKSLRFAMKTPADANSVIVTIDEEIKDGDVRVVEDWYNTNHAFIPHNYDADFKEVKEDINQLQIDATNLEESIKTVESKIENIGNVELPEHWESAIATAKTAIAEKQALGGVNCASFVWTTDIHAREDLNEKGVRLGRVAKAIMDEADIPLFISTGDLMSQTSYADPAVIYSELALVKKWLSPIPYDQQALIMGNHDGAWGETVEVQYDKQLPLEVVYNLIYRKQAMDLRRVSGGNGTYYYLDNASQKMRYIMLNTHNTPDYEENPDGTAKYNRFDFDCFGQTQLDWLIEVALDMPAGFTACLFGHTPYPGDLWQLAGIVDAYNTRKTSYSYAYTDSANPWRNSTFTNKSFANAKGEIAAVFAGHLHVDVIRHKDNSPVYATCPLISMTTSLGGKLTNRDMNFGAVQPSRTDKPTSEFAMDIVTVDTKHRKIYLTRLGAGADNPRSVSYIGTSNNEEV